jgi:hypothetical protein
MYVGVHILKLIIICDFMYAISLAIILLFLFHTVKCVKSDFKMCHFCVK